MKRPAVFGTILLLSVLAGCHESRPAAGGGTSSANQAPLRFAIAMDAAFAYREVAGAFTKQTGIPVEIVSGLSRIHRADVVNGAPYDGFASPKPHEVEQTLQSGRCLADPTFIYGIQRVAMWTAKGEPPKRVEDLADPKWARIAMTSHSAYGVLAHQALDHLGLWSTIEPRIVETDNMNEMEQTAQTTDVAVTALSVAIRLPGKYTEIDSSMFTHVNMQFVMCKAGKTAAREDVKQFIAFASTPESRAVFRRHGFYE